MLSPPDPGVRATASTVTLLQVPWALSFRLVAFVVVAVVAVAALYVVLSESDASDRVYEDEEDESGLYKPGPAYGATGTLDVEEVLQVDGEGSDDDGGSPGQTTDGPNEGVDLDDFGEAETE